eukprot:5892165-Pyramimonas_sp.AAC.1
MFSQGTHSVAQRRVLVRSLFGRLSVSLEVVLASLRPPQCPAWGKGGGGVSPAGLWHPRCLRPTQRRETFRLAHSVTHWVRGSERAAGACF